MLAGRAEEGVPSEEGGPVADLEGVDEACLVHECEHGLGRVVLGVCVLVVVFTVGVPAVGEPADRSGFCVVEVE